jgi:hypothetical protein
LLLVRVPELIRLEFPVPHPIHAEEPVVVRSLHPGGALAGIKIPVGGLPVGKRLTLSIIVPSE